MAIRISPLWFATILLAVATLVTGKEINSTEDLKKEETQAYEVPVRYEDASSSVSKSYSTSSSKSHGSGTGKGTGYGGSAKKGGGRGRGHGHYSSSGKGSGSGYSGPIEHGGGPKKPKIEVYSSEQGYGGQYDKQPSYDEPPHPGHGHGYGQGYDDRDSSAYAHPSYDKSEEAGGHHGYGGPVHVTSTSYTGQRDIPNHSEGGGSSSGESGGIKAEYVDYYPKQDVHSHTESHSTSSGSGYGKGTGGGSSKRGFRKEFRKLGYQAARGKSPGQGDDGQKLSVYIKQLGNQPSSHLSEISGGDYRDKNIRNNAEQGQKGYLLLPVVPNENLGSGYGTGSGGDHRGYTAGDGGQKVGYGHAGPEDSPITYGGQPSAGFEPKPQIYDLAHSPGQGYSHHGGNNGQRYGREQQPQQHSYSQADGGSRGKYRDISPRPHKEQQQAYYPSPAEAGSYKYPSDYEQPAGKVQQNVVNYDKPPRQQQQHSYREADSTGGSLEGQLYGGEEALPKNKDYGPSVYDFSSQGKPHNAESGYSSNGNYHSPADGRGPVKPRKVIPNGGDPQGKLRNQEGQYGGGYPNEEVEVKPINPNVYTGQRQQIEPLPEITFTPDAFFSKPLNNLKAQRQVINHGPMGVSMSYKTLGSDLTGLEGLDVLSAFDGRHPVFGIPEGRYPQQVPGNKVFGSQIGPNIQPIAQPQFNNQRTKSIALFLQKPNQYSNSGGFSPISNDFGGKFGFRGNSDIPPFDLYPGLSGMASTLMPLSLPFRPLF